MKRFPTPLLAGLLLLSACASTTGGWADADPAATTTTAAPTTATPATTAPTAEAPARPTTRDILAPLVIDDRRPPGGYRRDEWPHWLDLDGDGCDTRHQLLKETSEIPVEITPRCKVRSGRWTSTLDGVVATEASELDIDHVVPLAEAHRTGGHAWSTEQRARFANDPAGLLAVSRSVNRAKADDPPDRWRPPNRSSWCDYATRWVAIKVAYGLTARTAERDALGQMLDTCP